MTLNMVYLLASGLVLLACLSSGQCDKLKCLQDGVSCFMKAPGGTHEMRVLHIKCAGETCKDSFVIGDDNNCYSCQHESRQMADCQKLSLHASFCKAIRAYQLEIDQAVSAGGKRQLPFDTPMYGRDTSGRHKRQLPFDTPMYGSRQTNGECDCSSEAAAPAGNVHRRGLPYEPMMFGKRLLPYEIMGYGKRDMPSIGYIMGKREE